jgi:hypothetical protein
MFGYTTIKNDDLKNLKDTNEILLKCMRAIEHIIETPTGSPGGATPLVQLDYIKTKLVKPLLYSK